MIHINSFCTQCKKNYHHLKDEKEPISIQCEICNATLASISPINGYIYVLSNPCMPNLVKIGFTTRNIEERIAELNSSTGVPEPFVIEAIFSSAEPERDEQIIHTELDENRTNKNREFFQIEPLTVVNKLEKILGIPPDYNGIAEREKVCRKEEEKYIEQKHNALLVHEIFVEDPDW